MVFHTKKAWKTRKQHLLVVSMRGVHVFMRRSAWDNN